MSEGGWVVTYEDISERRKVEANTEYLAHHDVLTGLPNRLAFSLRLDHLLRNRSDRRTFALLIVDVDDFKDVERTRWVIWRGICCWVTIAQRLNARPRAGGALGGASGRRRIRHSADDAARAQLALRLLAQRVVDATDQPTTRRAPHSASVSIGIAMARG